MAKKIKVSVKDHPYTQLIKTLKNLDQLEPLVQQLQKNTTAFEKKISIADCLADLKANFAMLNSRLFFGMQIERLFAQNGLSGDIDSTFKKYQDIIGQDIVITQESRQKLDPNCKSELDFSSAINNYKKWLLQILFILFLTKPVEKFQYQDADLNLYLLYSHQIQLGYTISKVNLRSHAKIDAPVVLELAKNTDIRIHQQLSDTHWAYISLAETDVQGYVPMPYIKAIS